MSTEVDKHTPSSHSFSLPDSFRALRDEMDRMLHAFSTPQTPWAGIFASDGAMGLRVDIGERDGKIEIKADLPGVAEDEIDVTLTDDVLHIRAEKKSEADRGEGEWRVVERAHGLFERAVRVPGGVDPDAVEATFKKGVLTVTMPKPAQDKTGAKRIALNTAA